MMRLFHLHSFHYHDYSFLPLIKAAGLEFYNKKRFLRYKQQHEMIN